MTKQGDKNPHAKTSELENYQASLAKHQEEQENGAKSREIRWLLEGYLHKLGEFEVNTVLQEGTSSGLITIGMKDPKEQLPWLLKQFKENKQFKKIMPNADITEIEPRSLVPSCSMTTKKMPAFTFNFNVDLEQDALERILSRITREHAIKEDFNQLDAMPIIDTVENRNLSYSNSGYKRVSFPPIIGPVFKLGFWTN
jgi:hypothetical protein